MIDFLHLSESRLAATPAKLRFELARQFCECLGVVPRKVDRSLISSALG